MLSKDLKCTCHVTQPIRFIDRITRCVKSTNRLSFFFFFYWHSVKFEKRKIKSRNKIIHHYSITNFIFYKMELLREANYCNVTASQNFKTSIVETILAHLNTNFCLDCFVINPPNYFVAQQKKIFRENIKLTSIAFYLFTSFKRIIITNNKINGWSIFFWMQELFILFAIHCQNKKAQFQNVDRYN